MIKEQKLCLVYITTGTLKEAKNIGQILVKQKLVACVNILGEMNSIFSWKGNIEENAEVVMVAKTRKTHIPRLIKTVKNNHSYESPCILELPIQGGDPDFLNWILKETE